METILPMAQLLFSIGMVWGIYKTKIDLLQRNKDEVSELKERIARIEEKINFISQQLNNKKNEASI